MSVQHYAIHESLAGDGAFDVKLVPFSARIARGDLIVVFSRDESDVQFRGTCKVTDTRDRPGETSDSGQTIIVRSVSVSEVIELQSIQSLKVLSGSLEKVYRYLEPERHFGRNIVKLSQSDYETVTEGRIFIARSIFRSLFSALPIAVQAAFVQAHIEAFPLSSDGAVKNYDALATLLVRFLEDRLTEPLEMLSRITDLHGADDSVRLPNLNTLRLCSGQDPDGKRIPSVAFGATCLAAKRVKDTNPLFVVTQGEVSYLTECYSQLNNIDSATEGKTWTDPIF